MDKNTWIGFGLIAAIVIGFSLWNKPSKAELAERQRKNDSIAAVRLMEAETRRLTDSVNMELRAAEEATAARESEEAVADRLAQAYGPFAPAAQGVNTETVLENGLVRLHLNSLGGRIGRAELLQYKAYGDTVNPLCLFRGDDASTAFTLITANNRVLSTDNLYFEPIRTNDSTVTMRLKTDREDCWLDMRYSLPTGSYMIDYTIEPHNLQYVLAQNMTGLEMRWSQKIPQQEKGRRFEERYAQLQYRTLGGDIDKLSESKADTEKEGSKIQWIAYKDQFFSTVLIARGGMLGAQMSSEPMGKYSGYVKEYTASTSLEFDVRREEPIALNWYIGPNHYNTLKAFDKDLPEGVDKLNLKSLVPLGWKIVSWVNVILVIPMFDLFTSWGLGIGLIILLMTIVIKLIILPFVFKSYKSSAMMKALKPQVDEINAKYPPEKMQERQQATMALYQRAGASPMSGCLPMLFQMPVVMAMFWFFPTAIELRGQSFLWADDLSTYDDVIRWSMDLPLIGNHLSLFCILFTLVNVAFTYVNMQSQAMGDDPSQKMMKWMMYLMPLMFFFIFNDYAAGLSYYYLLSMFFSIAQTMIFRWTLDEKKMLAEMEKKAKKREGKPKSGFMKRLEEMQRQQQQMAREQAKAAQRR